MKKTKNYIQLSLILVTVINVTYFSVTHLSSDYNLNDLSTMSYAIAEGTNSCADVPDSYCWEDSYGLYECMYNTEPDDHGNCRDS